MSQKNGRLEKGGGSLNALFSCLASSERRHLLGYIHDHAPASITRDELATSLAANKNHSLEQVTNEERQQTLTAIHHVHLPKLDTAGLIRQNTTATTVELTNHPAYQDVGILAAITDNVSAESASLDALFRALADARRRTILDVLSHQYHPIKLQTLAHDIASPQRGGPPEDVEQVLQSLQHVHLPHLQEAGLIEYNTDEETVVYEGHPLLRVPWMHSELGSNFRVTLTDTPKDADIWTIDGREKTVSCGQSLCEEADEELFLMFTATGLLEAGCFSRIKQAADRGVDVYLGTADPTVQGFVREHAPEVTLWEPQTNWLNLPVDGENVGRLVFADREAVMIGTLGEKSDAGVHKEQAIFAEGADNTLVVLLQQMIRSQFAKLDDQTEDHDSESQSLF
ncbi:DUF7344 domain-containing protein [Haladaptatus salinisoli]|uniref:DUF7344 domain-containing protein n=1 Tax=Haladaptatus salinisoli TaxID=2884876 RepID=UPI001D0A69A0|nr:hypothetical protein [Haladaptatus salinisoli]